MTNLNFAELDNCFRNNDFPSIENDSRGVRFLKLRSLSRSGTMQELCSLHNIDLSVYPSRQHFSVAFELDALSDDEINAFIRKKYLEERGQRLANEDYIIDQLSRLQHFDWGGSFGNSLEKNIVDNYVKKIQSYDRMNEELEGSLFRSLKGYTLNSWYNHWTSILIEDLFKDHQRVLPTVGLVKKIDFFINDIPFDLKVTYFPEQLLAEKLREVGYGNELTRLKRICRQLNIFIPTDLKDRGLKLHLYTKVSEDQREEAKQFIAELKQQKRNIISASQDNPAELKKWFYENQGEARFDASNRFFLVLTDETDITTSWKLKRNIAFLREKVNAHLSVLPADGAGLEMEFYWSPTQQTFSCKSDILFVNQAE